MITTPIAAPEPACFGLVCPFHSRCARYAAVSLSEADPDTLVTCREGESFPLFVELETAVTVCSLSAAIACPIPPGKELHHAHHLDPIAQ